MMRIEITTHGFRLPITNSVATAVVRSALRRAGIKDAEVSVAFVNDTVMRRLNRAYRRRDRVTDVLSFGDLRSRSIGFPELKETIWKGKEPPYARAATVAD